MNIFVTGTDTGIGKTTVSAWICMHTQADYRKLIQTGNDSDGDTVKRISPHTRIIPEICRLKAPLSPYDAAKRENIRINSAAFRENYENTVFEGSGGALVPVTEDLFMADLVKQCGAAALIVAKSQSGMINHILMTAEILRARNADIIGIIVNGETDGDLIATVEKFSNLKVLSIIPRGDNLTETLRHTGIPAEISEIIK
ncbi:MAG: dethiobiotin synthase [Holosporaceae bacterium]|nr:dethiobiotin synthase [Holosporaceae bacterium]